MTRPFSIPTVLRMVPNDLLKQFLEDLGHGEFDPKWDELKKRDDIVQPFLAYMDELPRPKYDELESGLHNVSDLASDGGFNALLEAGDACRIPNLGTLVPEDLCVWGRTMWVWLNHREIFDKAQILYQIEHMSWWRKRNDLPQNAPDLSKKAIDKLARDISTLLKAQGRGKDCTVEKLKRGDMHYFFAYPDDFVQNVTVHDHESRLTVETFRQTLLIVFAYNQAEGSLEMCAKGLHKPVKEKLERIFAGAVLHWDLGGFDPDAAYELDQLKDPFFDLRTDPADRVSVRIRKMRLSSTNSGRRILIEVDDDDPDDDIHKAIEECINLDNAPLSEWHATLVTFCFEFKAMDGRKPGRQSFDVGYPRSCSLRNARPERVELIQKYLKRWKIDLAAPVESVALPLGD